MSTRQIPYGPEQQYLMPCDLQEWLPAGHLAYFVSDTEDSLDLKAFHAPYPGGGTRNQQFHPAHPAMTVEVLVYGYATGVFNSRKIDNKFHEEIAFRVLAPGIGVEYHAGVAVALVQGKLVPHQPPRLRPRQGRHELLHPSPVELANLAPA